MNTYGPAVLALLQQELKPNQICAALGLCSSGNHCFLPLSALIVLTYTLVLHCTCRIRYTMLPYVYSHTIQKYARLLGHCLMGELVAAVFSCSAAADDDWRPMLGV